MDPHSCHQSNKLYNGTSGQSCRGGVQLAGDIIFGWLRQPKFAEKLCYLLFIEVKKELGSYLLCTSFSTRGGASWGGRRVPRPPRQYQMSEEQREPVHEVGDAGEGEGASRELNRQLKTWGIVSQVYRQDVLKHGDVFQAYAVATQLTNKNGEPLFEVEYTDSPVAITSCIFISSMYLFDQLMEGGGTRGGEREGGYFTAMLSRNCYCSHSKVFSLISPNSLCRKLRHQRGVDSNIWVKKCYLQIYIRSNIF